MIENEIKEKLSGLYEAYGKKMLYVALNIVKNQQDAEDVVQDSFIAVSKNMSSIGEIDSYKTSVYMVITAKNRALNLIKKRNNTQVFDLATFENTLSTTVNNDEKIDISDEVKFVLNEIKQLSENYRDVLTLFFVNELSLTEISHLIDKPYNTVKTDFRRGRKILLSKITQRRKSYEEE
ncbi:MAG: sigma-70 family RNA polymerase sigma factor [Clostridia bacterium]